jgi:hypothetical protein
LDDPHPHLTGPLYAVAAAIALARVYCDVNHLTDTIAGAKVRSRYHPATASRSDVTGRA